MAKSGLWSRTHRRAVAWKAGIRRSPECHQLANQPSFVPHSGRLARLKTWFSHPDNWYHEAWNSLNRFSLSFSPILPSWIVGPIFIHAMRFVSKFLQSWRNVHQFSRAHFWLFLQDGEHGLWVRRGQEHKHMHQFSDIWYIPFNYGFKTSFDGP